MENYLIIAIIIVLLTILFGLMIINENMKPKYEIRFIEGWFIIRDVKTETHLKRFKSQEEAEIWFNENCL